MQQPTDGMAKDQQEEISYSIIATVDEITELAIQSSKELFEGILVDLDPIDRDKLVNRFLPTDPTCQSMIEALQKILEEMALNSNAAKKNPTLMPKLVRNAKDLNSALISLKDLVAKEIESEESEQRRKELQGVLDLLDAIMRDDILQSLKAAMENPNDDSLDSLLQAIAKMANALDRLKRLLNGEEDFDLLNGSVSKLQNALRSLQAALTKGDQEGMLSATKEAVARMKSQKGTIEDVSPSLMKLVEGTKAAMANPSDISAGDRLRKALEECRGSTHNLSPSSILPRSQLVTAMQILNEAGDLLVSNPKDSDKGLLGKELNQKGLDSLSHIIEQYTKNHPKHKGLLEKGNHLLTKSNSQLLMAVNESNISLAKKEQSNQRDAMIDLLNTALLAESDEAEMNALIDSATFLNHMLSKLNEATKLGDEFGATDAAKTAENTLSKEGLLIEMIAKKRIGITNPGAEARLMLLADDLQLERQELPEITIATLQDVTQHPRVSSCIAKVRNLNKEILGQLMTDKQIGDKMADINIDIELDADNIENILSTPVSQQMPDIQEPLSRICEEIGQQQLLSQSLLHNLPKDATATRRDTLQKALIGVDGTVNKLRTAAADAMKPAADRIAKNRLKKALNDVAIKSEELTAASQSSLIDRILNNGSKFNTLCGTISNSNDESNAFKAVKDGKALKRIQKQIVLCNQMANQCNDPQLKLVTRKLLEFARTSVQQVENIIPQATVSTQAAPLFDRLRQVNEKLMIAAQRAENCSLKTDINSLGDAANHMEQASKFLEIDDSPKGRLNALAKKIAEEMKKMADGAERKDKRAIITSAKTISQLTNNVVKIAAEIPSSDKFKQFKNEMLSMAHAARNYSVVSKLKYFLFKIFIYFYISNLKFYLLLKLHHLIMTQQQILN